MTISKCTGPMKAGKSFKLIKDWLNNTDDSVCIKPIIASRDGAWIKSRACNVQIPCIMIGPGIGHSFSGVDTLFVDEAHFFSLKELRYLSRMAPNVHFYGLDRWADGESTTVGELVTDNAEVLTATCKCGAEANFTKHVYGDDPITAVYAAVCRKCWLK